MTRMPAHSASGDSQQVERVIALLLECTRINPNGTRIEAALAGITDWKLMRELAWEHGLVPILYDILDKTGRENLIPEAERVALNGARSRSTQRGLSLTGELLRVLNAFHSEGVSVIPYKGPALAALLYDPPSLRQFGDLDILVSPRDVPAAIAVLTQLDYMPTLALTDAGMKALVASQCELAFRHETHGIVLELHWRLSPRYFSLPLEADEIWERRSVVTIRGKESASISPEDLLLVLCIHGARHIWQRLSWIRDVAQLIAVSPELDWQRVLRTSAERGGARILAVGLYLASKWGGAALPPDVQMWVSRDRRIPSLSAEILARMQRNESSAPDLFAVGWFVVRARERWRDRVLYVARLALDLGPVDLEHWTAERPVPLQYLLRPLRLSRKYGRMLLERRF